MVKGDTVVGRWQRDNRWQTVKVEASFKHNLRLDQNIYLTSKKTILISIN